MLEIQVTHHSISKNLVQNYLNFFVLDGSYVFHFYLVVSCLAQSLVVKINPASRVSRAHT